MGGDGVVIPAIIGPVGRDRRPNPPHWRMVSAAATVLAFVPEKPEVATFDQASERLDDEYLRIRAGLLELAARLDRIQQGQGSAQDDPRMAQIGRAIAALALDGPPDRARNIQMIFSLAYDQRWREKFGI